MRRSFTYVDDVVEPIKRLLNNRPTSTRRGRVILEYCTSNAPYRVLNIGGGESLNLVSLWN